MTSNSPEEPLWLCLYFPQLPLEVFLRGLSAEDADKPAVVVERARVCRLNAAAIDLGILPGNNMDTAYTLSEHVIAFERDTQKETRALSQLAGWAYQFTPNVSIKSPDSLLLEVGGCLRLFKGLARLKTLISTRLANHGYEPCIGVSRTPLAALYHARSRLDDNLGDVAGALSPGRIEALDVDDVVAKSLAQMGICTIGELLRLPESGLTRRFGVYFSDYLARLVGRKPDPRKYIQPEPRFHSEISFLSDITDKGPLLFPIRRLLGELCDYMLGRQLGTSYLSWKLMHRSHPARSFSVYLANAENDPAIFLPLTQLRLDQVTDVSEIDSISLTVNRFSPLRAESGDLFHGTSFAGKDGTNNDSRSARANTDHLFNMLNARLGPGSAFGLSIVSDHRPEKAWRPVRIGQKPLPVPYDDVDENPRPIFLLNTPRALNVVDGEPCLDGRLVLLRGPERIDFGWWDQQTLSKPIGRDYYIARQRSGALLWVFHHLIPPDGRWYLHGIFS
ncbi:MAG: DNA polymerase Y family protein [Pseudomonadales bacterium]|nr:DNA polymerase Y family protein [Pseudomonadales bacterium]